jgi:hypothetical protein
MRRNTLFAALGGLILVLLAFWVVNMSRGGGDNPDKLDDATASATGIEADAETAAADGPAQRCGSQKSYDLVGRELFRVAAATRGSDAAAFQRLAGYAAVRVSSPVVRRRDEGLDTTVCSGAVTIDLPPGVEVAGGRRSLSATIDYALQPAADGSGDVVTLSGAEPIVVPLATLSKSSDLASAQQQQQAAPVTSESVASTTDTQPSTSGARPSAQPSAPPPVRRAPAPPPVLRPTPSTPAPQVATSNARPSFNCRNARTFGERAVCGSSGLASLDRQMASQFNRAAASAGPGERALLNRTRTRFLGYRDGCRSNDCVADAYRGRMREIDDIMAGRWRER